MPLHRWLVTTPGRLRAGSVLIVAALLLVGVVAVAATAARRDASRTVAADASPALVAAQGLYAVLADADATTLSAYLAPKADTTDLLERYDRDIDRAGRFLAVLGSAGSAPTVRSAVATMADALPRYTAAIEASRAETRAGNSVSSAYLRRASKTMREEILPQATVLFEHAARQLDDAYEMGTSSTHVVLLVVTAVLAFLLLLGVQWLLFARTHRVVNVALVGATLVLVLLLGWVAVTWTSQQRDLHDARSHGSDAVQILAATRVLALRAASDDNLTLIEQGGGTAYVNEYDVLAQRIGGDGGTGGLLAIARTVADRTGSADRIDHIADQWSTLSDAHARLTAKYDQALYGDALGIATETQRPAVEALDRSLGIEIARARVELEEHASDDTAGMTLLLLVVPLFTVGGIVLVLVGLQRRIVEYR